MACNSFVNRQSRKTRGGVVAENVLPSPRWSIYIYFSDKNTSRHTAWNVSDAPVPRQGDKNRLPASKERATGGGGWGLGVVDCHWRELPQVLFLSRQNTNTSNACFSPQNTSFVATKICLSPQNICRNKITVCRDKHVLSRQAYFLSRQTRVCLDKTRILSRQKNACCNKTFVATKIMLVAAPPNDSGVGGGSGGAREGRGGWWRQQAEVMALSWWLQAISNMDPCIMVHFYCHPLHGNIFFSLFFSSPQVPNSSITVP